MKNGRTQNKNRRALRRTAAVILSLILGLSRFGAQGPGFAAPGDNLPGDVDADGVLTAADARLAARYAAGLETPDFDLSVADADLDARVTEKDAMLLLKAGVGLVTLEAPPLSGEDAPDVPSKAAALFDVTANKLLWAKGLDEPCAPASLTKLLTAVTALTLVPADEDVTVGDEIDLIGYNSSVCYLQKGWTLPLRTLLTGLLCPSGNDAAYTIAVNAARYAGLSDGTDEACVSAFVEKMNATAAELGMRNSVFCNPDGYDAEGQHTTARDLIVLALAAIRFEAVTAACDEHVEIAYFSNGEPVSWAGTDRLLDPDDEYYEPCARGLKTGSTPEAGCCLISLFEKDGRTLLTVTLGNETDEDRYESALALLAAAANA